MKNHILLFNQTCHSKWGKYCKEIYDIFKKHISKIYNVYDYLVIKIVNKPRNLLEIADSISKEIEKIVKNHMTDLGGELKIYSGALGATRVFLSIDYDNISLYEKDINFNIEDLIDYFVLTKLEDEDKYFIFKDIINEILNNFKNKIYKIPDGRIYFYDPLTAVVEKGNSLVCVAHMKDYACGAYEGFANLLKKVVPADMLAELTAWLDRNGFFVKENNLNFIFYNENIMLAYDESNHEYYARIGKDRIRAKTIDDLLVRIVKDFIKYLNRLKIKSTNVRILYNFVKYYKLGSFDEALIDSDRSFAISTSDWFFNKNIVSACKINSDCKLLDLGKNDLYVLKHESDVFVRLDKAKGVSRYDRLFVKVGDEYYPLADLNYLAKVISNIKKYITGVVVPYNASDDTIMPVLLKAGSFYIVIAPGVVYA